MKLIHVLIIFTLLILMSSCKTDKPPIEVKPDESGPLALFLEKIENPMGYMIQSETRVDSELFTEIFKMQSKYGKGFNPFIYYCSKLKPGDLPTDDCVLFIKAMTEGGWREMFDKNISEGTGYTSFVKTIIFLEKSVKDNHSGLSMKLINHAFSQMDLISDPQVRVLSMIHFASDLHLAGFDGMKKRVVMDSDFLLKAIDKEKMTVTEVELFSAIAKTAAVDLNAGIKLKDNLFSKPLLMNEALVALSAGLLLSDYQLGKQYFYQAMDEFDPLELSPEYSGHTVFELAYTRLNEKDQQESFVKFMKVLDAFRRLPILPPVAPGTPLVFEPELPAWYRDALYHYLVTNLEPAVRLAGFNSEMIKHVQRFPRSKRVDEYIGWEFEWLKQVKDPSQKYVLLGELCVVPNIIFPERVEKSFPQIMKLAEGFEKLVPELSLNGALLEALLVENPVELRERLDSQPSFNKENDLIKGLFALLRARHYLFPKNDSGLARFMDRILHEWENPSSNNPLEKDSMLIELWAGWDDDKAWDYFTKMNYKEGEYPRYLINIIGVIRFYSPGLARRFFDDLISKYKEGFFTQTNPQMEMSLALELTRSSIPWAEELASVIIEKRGNESPVFSFYLIYEKILNSAILSGADSKDIEKLCLKIQETLREDLKKYQAMEQSKPSS